VGLLPAGNYQQVPFAYKMYSREDETGWKQSTAFKKAFSIDVEIEFVGVWYALSLTWFIYWAPNAWRRDTVSSVGIMPRTLPFTASNTSIRYFRHAISLDERRAKFKANYFHLRRPDEQKGTKPGEMPRSNQCRWCPSNLMRHNDHKGKVLPDEQPDEQPDDGSTQAVTDVLEVWFSGCHSGNSLPVVLTLIYLVLTPSCRHWWGISQEWLTKHIGQNPASLDDPPMLSCQHRNPILPQDLQTHWPRSCHSLPFRNPTARGPRVICLLCGRNQGFY